MCIMTDKEINKTSENRKDSFKNGNKVKPGNLICPSEASFFSSSSPCDYGQLQPFLPLLATSELIYGVSTKCS